MTKLLHSKFDPIVSQSLPLRQSQFDALLRLAEKLDITASKGPNVGKPSWRAMMARLSEWDTPKDAPTPLDEFITEYFGLEDVIKQL
jgi:hypothetical protein